MRSRPPADTATPRPHPASDAVRARTRGAAATDAGDGNGRGKRRPAADRRRRADGAAPRAGRKRAPAAVVVATAGDRPISATLVTEEVPAERPRRGNGDGKGSGHGSTRRDRDTDLERLRNGLRRLRDGDFTYRLGRSEDPDTSELFDLFDDVAGLHSGLTDEIVRVSRTVGREGQMGERVLLSGATGGWGVDASTRSTRSSATCCSRRPRSRAC